MTARRQGGLTTGTFRTPNSNEPPKLLNLIRRINREYALGRKRTDLSIEWPVSDKGFFGEVQRIVIELKILHGSLDRCIEKGLIQTADYADLMGASEAYLVVFDRNSEASWEDQIWQRKGQYLTRSIGVWGC